jgi:RHS repeat-associated protein
MTSTDRTYTGQRDITGTGLMDYNFRMYSPLLGRFTQPDSIIPGAANSQNWNRYSYTRNNPINFNDPSGHVTCDGSGDTCKAQTKIDTTSSPIKINLPPPGGGGPKNDDDHPHGVGDPDDIGDYCDPVLGCENPDAGIFCNETQCWQDGATSSRLYCCHHSKLPCFGPVLCNGAVYFVVWSLCLFKH